MSELFKNRIAGIEKMTLLDYEDHLSCILFYNGCNLRCPYCYNGDLACGKAKNMDGNEIISFLINRVGKLDSVVFSGGECTIHGENLKNDIYFVKDLGYKVKVDTNGSNPELLKDLIESNLVNYIALDYKNSNKTPLRYSDFKANPEYIKNFRTTLCDILMKQDKVPFEIRTTVHTDVIDETNIQFILKDLQELNYKGNYYIQFFFPGPDTIANVNQHPRRFDVEKIKKYIKDNNITVNVLFRNEKFNV